MSIPLLPYDIRERDSQVKDYFNLLLDKEIPAIFLLLKLGQM